MKTIIKILAILIMFISFTQCSRNENDTTLSENALGIDAQIITITATEKGNLLFMYEEEKMARDTYSYLYQKWQLAEFKNIQQSEQSHMNAVENLLIKYNIAYPKLAQGIFQNQNIQTLYNQLTTQGSINTIEALKVGTTIEDVDIKDLKDLSTKTNNSSILKVYSNLMCGSRNHMRAFSGSLKNLGVTYIPQFITQAEYDAIINSANEQCGN